MTKEMLVAGPRRPASFPQELAQHLWETLLRARIRRGLGACSPIVDGLGGSLTRKSHLPAPMPGLPSAAGEAAEAGELSPKGDSKDIWSLRISQLAGPHMPEVVNLTLCCKACGQVYVLYTAMSACLCMWSRSHTLSLFPSVSLCVRRLQLEVAVEDYLLLDACANT